MGKEGVTMAMSEDLKGYMDKLDDEVKPVLKTILKYLVEAGHGDDYMDAAATI
jgi:hypothetical protein